MKTTRQKKPNNYLTSFTKHLTEQYGKSGTPAREEFEKGFEVFKSKAVKQELPKRKPAYE